MWIHLNYDVSICSAVLAESPSLSGTTPELLPTVTTIPSAKISYSVEWQAVILTLPPSGTMSKPCQRIISRPKSTSSLLDSPAKTFPATEIRKAWKESRVGFSTKSPVLLMNYDHSSFSWKMLPTLPKKDCERLRQRFPDCGMIVDGSCYQLPQLVPLTRGKGGLCLPTLTCTDGTAGAVLGKEDRYIVTGVGTVRREIRTGQSTSLSLGRYVQLVPKDAVLTPGTEIRPFRRGKLNPLWCEWLMGYPTNWTQIGGFWSL